MRGIELAPVQPNPLPRWMRLWEDGATRPFQWFMGGYGSGKTTYSVFEVFLNAMVRHPGMLGIMAAPTYGVLLGMWKKEWDLWMAPYTGLWTFHPSNTEGYEIRFSNGSVVLLRSTTSPTANEGPNAAWVVFEEASREPSQASYDVLTGRVRRPYPGRMGTVLIIGPPASRSHWTANEFGYSPGTRTLNGKTITFEGDAFGWHTDTHCVVRSRTRDNPFLPDWYEPNLRTRPGATAKWCDQYLDAEFGSIEGAVWPQFQRSRHVVPAASLAGRRWKKVVCGVDWGFSHPGVMIVVATDFDGNAWVIDEEVHQGKTVDDLPDSWGPIAKALAKRTGFTEAYCDPSSPANILSLGRILSRSGVWVYPANNDVAEGLLLVGSRFEAVGEDKEKKTEWVNGREYPVRQPALWISDKCVKLIDRIEGYERKKVRGAWSESPSELNDDECDGLRYAIASIPVRP